MHKKYLYALAGGSAIVAAGYAFGTPLDFVVDAIASLPFKGLEGVALGMAVVQGSYSERMTIGAPGQIASMHSYDADTRTVENSNGIPFGRAVGRGTQDKGCVLGASAAGQFLGISIRDVTLNPVAADSDYVDEYQQYASAGILVRGDIWVQVGGAVNDGDDVTYNSLTGVISSTATGGSQFAITGARFMTTAANNGLAIVRLSGYSHNS